MSYACRVCEKDVTPFHSFDRVSLLNKPLVSPLAKAVARMTLTFCGRCQHLSSFLEGDYDITHLTDTIYGELYANMTATTFSPSQEAFTRHVGAWLAKFAEGRQHSILEIGCHDGFLLNLLKENGHSCVGIEPSPYAKRAAEQYGLDVRQCFFEDGVVPRASFDLVLLRHVAEHVPNPTSFLRAVVNTLKPGGYLYVEVPNSLASIAECFYPEFHADHISYFTPSSLIWMLREVGLGHFAHFETVDAYMAFPFMGALVKRGRGEAPERSFSIQGYKMPFYLDRFVSQYEIYRRALRRLPMDGSVGVWGTGSIGNRYALDWGLEAEPVKYFDINPVSVGKRLSVTGNAIHHPRDIRPLGVRLVLLATGWEADARRQLESWAGNDMPTIRFRDLVGL